MTQGAKLVQVPLSSYFTPAVCFFEGCPRLARRSAGRTAMSTDVLNASSPKQHWIDRAKQSPFDLVARASLAASACAGLSNSRRTGQPLGYVELHTDPPVAMHSPWDYADLAGCLSEALTLSRIMTGDATTECDEALLSILAASQKTGGLHDGLLTIPADPWTHTAPVTEMEWSQRGALMAWTTRWLAMEDRSARDKAQKLVHALWKTAVWEGDVCWFPSSYFPAKGWANRFPPDRMSDVLIGAQVIFAVARYANATGDVQSLELAGGLIKFLKERSGAFDKSGKITKKTGRYLHSSSGFILGVLYYGVQTENAEYIDWAAEAYHQARDLGSVFGFFPHGLEGVSATRGDVCMLADMIEIAILLGEYRDPAYFGEAERFGRNHLLESQLLNYRWVAEAVDVPFCQEIWCANHPTEGIVTEGICEKAIGAFSSWTKLNDGIDHTNPRLFLRSSASGTRALYDLWHYGVSRLDGAVRVNLHFSRDTRWATVTSHLPEVGRLDVMMKTRGVLSVRLPAGVTDPDILVNENVVREEVVRNGCIWLEALQPGDMVQITWELEKKTLLFSEGDLNLTSHWTGDTLMNLSPAGALYPLYQRASDMTPAMPLGATGPVKEIDTL